MASSDDVSELTMPVENIVDMIPPEVQESNRDIFQGIVEETFIKRMKERADDCDAYISLLEQQLVQVKLELANARSSEDSLRHDLAKAKSDLEQARKCDTDNEANICRVSSIDELVDESNGHVRKSSLMQNIEGIVNSLRSESVHHSFKMPSKTDVRVKTGERLRRSNNYGPYATKATAIRDRDSNLMRSFHDNTVPKMPNAPSCASGIAFLRGMAPQSSTNPSTSFYKPKSIRRRPPSCASAINLLQMASSMASMSSLGKRKASNFELAMSVDDFGATAAGMDYIASASSLQKRSKCSTATSNSSASRYANQRNAEWRDATNVAPMGGNALLF